MPKQEVIKVNETMNMLRIKVYQLKTTSICNEIVQKYLQ